MCVLLFLNYSYRKYSTLVRDSPYLKMVVGFDVAYGILLAACGRFADGLQAAGDLLGMPLERSCS